MTRIHHQLLSLFIVVVGLAGAQAELQVDVATFAVGSDGRVSRETTGDPGEVIKYRLNARNVGNRTMFTGAEVIGPVPEGTSYVPGSASGPQGARLEYSRDGENFRATAIENPVALKWRYTENLPPRTSFMVTYRVVIDDPDADAASRTATAQVGRPSPTRSQQGESEAVQIDLEIFRVDSLGHLQRATTAGPGEWVEYHLDARNTTPDTLPSGTVEVTGPVPDGTTYVRGSATGGSNLLLEYSMDGEHFDEEWIEEPEAIRWTILEPMEPRQSVALTFRVRVDGGDRFPGGRAGGKDSDAFTQAMFGHLGVIEISCPGDYKDDPTLICGEVFSDFRRFQREWDLYADWESEVPVVPVPTSAWRRDDNTYTRYYEMGRSFYSVNFTGEGDGYGFIFIYAD